MYKITDRRRNTNEIILGIGLVPNVSLILSVGHRFKGGGILRWVKYMVL